MVTIFFPSMEGGLARRIFLVRQQHYCQAGEVGQTITLLPAHSRSHSLTTFFFGPMELFTYPQTCRTQSSCKYSRMEVPP